MLTVWRTFNYHIHVSLSLSRCYSPRLFSATIYKNVLHISTFGYTSVLCVTWPLQTYHSVRIIDVHEVSVFTTILSHIHLEYDCFSPLIPPRKLENIYKKLVDVMHFNKSKSNPMFNRFYKIMNFKVFEQSHILNSYQHVTVIIYFNIILFDPYAVIIVFLKTNVFQNHKVG